VTDPDTTKRRKSRLRAEAIQLSRYYGRASFDEKDGAWLHVEQFSIPPGWNKSKVEILIDIPWGTPGYPSLAPHWFWTDRDLATSTGRSISHFFTAGNGLADQQYLDRGWGHFCVHVNDWRPAGGANLLRGHSLISYLNLIRAIFSDRRTLSR